MSKILVAYFSASGTTARVAKELAQATGADLERLWQDLNLLLPRIPPLLKENY